MNKKESAIAFLRLASSGNMTQSKVLEQISAEVPKRGPPG